MVLLAFAESIQLFPDGTLFIHIALILIMIWVLNRTFFRPINRVIASREKFRGGRNVEADEILGSVAEKERAEAVAARTEKIAAARIENAQTFDAEQKELTTHAETARAAIAKEAEVMADRITASILKA